ncbi:type VI secretion protein [Pseudomonas sp. D47]
MHRLWPVAVLAFVLAGCTGNYRFSDAEYRPLGTPQAAVTEQRGA